MVVVALVCVYDRSFGKPHQAASRKRWCQSSWKQPLRCGQRTQSTEFAAETNQRMRAADVPRGDRQVGGEVFAVARLVVKGGEAAGGVCALVGAKDWPRHPIWFAGSWKGDAYEERTESIAVLLDPVIRRGLHIIDRNLAGGTPARTCVPRPLPRRHQGLVALPADAHRLRVLRGTPVVSIDSVGMGEMLDGHVRVGRTV